MFLPETTSLCPRDNFFVPLVSLRQLLERQAIQGFVSKSASQGVGQQPQHESTELPDLALELPLEHPDLQKFF